MNTRKLTRIAALAAMAILAVGAIGYAASPSKGTTTSHDVLIEPDEAYAGTDGDVMAAIDQALGRAPATVPEASAGRPDAALPPISDAIGKESSSLIRPEQQPSGPTDPLALSQTEDRKIVQTASLKLQVKQVGASFEEVGRIATANGGFVASSNFALQGDDQIASLTVRVPAGRYQDTLRDFRALGHKVEAESSNASDVSEQYSDLAARLRTLEATEAQLFELLGRAANVNEILMVQDRLNAIRSEIERVKGRIALFDKLTDLATITVHLRPVPAGITNGTGVDLGAEVSEAWEASLDFLASIAAGVLRVLVFGWWLPLVALPAYVLTQRYLRSRAAAVAD
jgi:hypothetical protein